MRATAKSKQEAGLPQDERPKRGGGRPKQLHDKRSPEARGAALDKVWLPRIEDARTAREADFQMEAQRQELDALMLRQLDALHPRQTPEATPGVVGPLPSPDNAVRDQRRGPRDGHSLVEAAKRQALEELELMIGPLPDDFQPPEPPEEVKRILAARRKAEEPISKLFRKIEQRRDKQDQSGQLPFDDRAMERLRADQLKRAELLKTLGAKSPEYISFMAGFVSWYNVASTTDRCCERCFEVFALTENGPRERFCSKKCGNRNRDQRRGRDGRARLLQKLDATEKILKRHRENCREGCTSVALCDYGISLMNNYTTIPETLAHPWAIDSAPNPDPED